MIRKLKALTPLFLVLLIYFTYDIFQHVEDKLVHEDQCDCLEAGQKMETLGFQVPDNVTLAKLNVTGRAERVSLFFNRVPKVGSQSINKLLQNLATMNDFSFARDGVNNVEQIVMSREKEKVLAKDISKHPTGSVYSKHVAMVDFSRYNLPNPIYINMVRHPTDRLVSWFYYIRAAWYVIERHRLFPSNPLPLSSWLKKDFDTCVMDPSDFECKYLMGDMEGFGDHRRQSIFFCGMDTDCVPFNSKVAIAKAKENVEKYYAVVGVLEDLNKTLTVLEHFVPRFFCWFCENILGNLKHRQQEHFEAPSIRLHQGTGGSKHY